MSELATINTATGELVDEFGAVQLARNAWASIKANGSELRENWLTLATGLDVGRQECKNKHGKLNTNLFGKWCVDEGFGDLDKRDRSNALWLLDNADAVLGNAQITFNSPTHMRKQYRAIEKQEKLEQAKADNAEKAAQSVAHNPPTIKHQSCADFLSEIAPQSVDLLITDPPYSTDVGDIESFVGDWVYQALDKVKDDGRAFICIGAYPAELHAYLGALLSYDRFKLDNPLIWTYRNALGQIPKDRYNLNYQVILHLYSEASDDLDTSITNEMFSVQDINAPDGRVGDRYHTWQKPDELANRLIRHATKEGDAVIDPFACTGTFLIAAARHGCKASGCDVDQGAIDIATSRGCIDG